MRHKPVVGTVTVATALAIALAGCANTAPAADDRTITFLSFYDDAAVQKMVAAFNEEHPEITVEHQTVPFPDLSAAIDSRLSGGSDDVDVYMADQPRIASLYDLGYLADVSDTVDDTSIWLDNAVEASTVDGKLVAYPVNTSTGLLYYNKDALAAAGVPFPSTDPADRITWEALVDEAATVQSAGTKYGFQFDQVSRYYQLQPLPESLGGGSGLTGNGNLTPDVTNDGWQKAMEFYASMYADGVAPRGITPEETATAFESGDTAFFVGGPHHVAAWTDGSLPFELGIAAHPVFADGEAVTPTGAWSIGINPSSNNTADAETFASWVTSTSKGTEAFLGVDAGIPAQLTELDTYLASGIWAVDDGGTTLGDLVREEVSTTAVNRPRSVGYLQFEEIMGSAFEDIRNGQPVADTLDAAQARLTDAFARLG